MVEEPSHVKQLSLNHVCKIGLKVHKHENIFCSDIEFLTFLWLVMPKYYFLEKKFPLDQYYGSYDHSFLWLVMPKYYFLEKKFPLDQYYGSYIHAERGFSCKLGENFIFQKTQI
jgi:hypothetical protein